MADPIYAGIDRARVIIVAIGDITFRGIIRDSTCLVHRRTKIGQTRIGGASTHAIGMKSSRTFTKKCARPVIHT